jgi:hypothetical protein
VAKKKDYRDKGPRCTPAEKQAINDWLEHLEKAAQTAIDRFNTVPKADRPQFMTNNIEHWEKVKQALSWARGLNLNRKPNRVTPTP